MSSFGFGLSILLVLAAGAQSIVERENRGVPADKVILLQQKRIIDLLRHVYEPNLIPEILEIAETYKIEENLDKYKVPVAVTNFMRIVENGLLPRDDVFSIFNDNHRSQAIALFELLYFAKDMDTFFRTACWARINVNPGQFVYALMVSTNHREDMRGIVLPPLYEINPHFFVDADVMQKAVQVYANQGGGTEDILIRANSTTYLNGSPNPVYRDINYVLPEKRLRYFTEDVALNVYNNYYHLNNPFWMNITVGRRGELFWYYHQQLLARYLQERFANDLPNFEAFRINDVIEEGYNPRLRYPNGKYFSVRPDNIQLDNTQGYDIKLVEDFERRIRDAIDLGFVIGEDGERIRIDYEHGLDHLGHLIQSTVKSINRKYYGNLYQLTMQVLGRIVDPRRFHNIPPSVLEHFETALRDPLHYRLVANIVQLFTHYNSLLPSYVRKELHMPGVKVDNIEVSKLNTFFEDFDFDISNGIMKNKPHEELVVSVRQYRLNHFPFVYYINITAEKPINGMVRTFIGLRYNTEGHVLDMNERRKYMVQVDNFPIELKTGLNTIERKSNEMTVIKKRNPTMRELYKEVNEALQGNGEYVVEEINQECGYPGHLLLPKGKVEGMPYSFYVSVSSYNPKDFENVKYGCGNGRGLFYQDQHSMGFPFDRVIDEREFHVPNFHEKEVFIYHTPTPNRVVA